MHRGESQISNITQRSKVKLRAYLPRHCSYSEEDLPVAEEHEHQRQEEAEDEQTADIRASRGCALVPLDRAGGARTLQPIAAPQHRMNSKLLSSFITQNRNKQLSNRQKGCTEQENILFFKICTHFKYFCCEKHEKCQF